MPQYPVIFPKACCEKHLKDNKDNILHLALKISSDICPWTLSVPQSSQFSSTVRSRKTVRFSEQIMSADKYPSIFSPQMENIFYKDEGIKCCDHYKGRCLVF